MANVIYMWDRMKLRRFDLKILLDLISNCLIRILSQTRFPSNAIKFESKI